MAFIDFTAGDSFTAAQADTLMRQGVMSFASSAARASALSGITLDGMVTWLDDEESLEYYYDAGPDDGWVSINGSIEDAQAAAAVDATTKADAAAVLGTANAKTYTDNQKIETLYIADTVVSGNTTNTTPSTILDTANVTSTKDGHYLVSVTLDVELKTTTGTAPVFIADLQSDGETNPEQILWLPVPQELGTRATLSKTWIIPASAGERDFKVRAYQNISGGSYRVEGIHSTLHALFVG